MTGRRVHLETLAVTNELDKSWFAANCPQGTSTDERTQADVVIYNTCSVREQAEKQGLESTGHRRC